MEVLSVGGSGDSEQKRDSQSMEETSDDEEGSELSKAMTDDGGGESVGDSDESEIDIEDDVVEKVLSDVDEIEQFDARKRFKAAMQALANERNDATEQFNRLRERIETTMAQTGPEETANATYLAAYEYATQGYVQAKLAELKDELDTAEATFHDGNYAEAVREFNGIASQLSQLKGMVDDSDQAQIELGDKKH